MAAPGGRREDRFPAPRRGSTQSGGCRIDAGPVSRPVVSDQRWKCRAGRGSGPTNLCGRRFGRETAFNWPWLLPLKLAYRRNEANCSPAVAVSILDGNVEVTSALAGGASAPAKTAQDSAMIQRIRSPEVTKPRDPAPRRAGLQPTLSRARPSRPSRYWTAVHRRSRGWSSRQPSLGSGLRLAAASDWA